MLVGAPGCNLAWDVIGAIRRTSLRRPSAASTLSGR